MRLLLLVIAILSIRLRRVIGRNYSCKPIKICSYAQMYRVGRHDRDMIHFRLPTEQQVAGDRHILGIKPVAYTLQFRFDNQTHYTGEFMLTLQAVRPSSRLMLNADWRRLNLDYWSVFIDQDCKQPLSPTVCIQRITHLEQDDALLIDLNGNLRQDVAYRLSIGSFQSFVYDEKRRTGSAGLRRTGNDRFAAIGTFFQLRQARTVFPCMDHPALKAKFQLTIEHSSEFFAISSTKLSGPSAVSICNGDRLRSNFRLSSPMSTHAFGFFLLKGYEQIVDIDRTPNLRLFAPSGKANRFAQLFNYSRSIFAIIDRQIGESTQIEHIDLLALYPVPMENARRGILTINDNLAEMQSITTSAELSDQQRHDRKRLLHGLLQQMLLSAASVDNWSDICLEEGLITYMRWKLEAALSNDSALIDRHVNRESKMPYFEYESLVGPHQNFRLVEDIFDRCDSVPPVIYRLIDRWHNDTLLPGLFHALSANRSAIGFGATIWEQSLIQISKDHRRFGNFVDNWFRQSGPLTLRAELDGDGGGITIVQIVKKSEKPRVLVLLVYVSSSPRPIRVVFKEKSIRVVVPRNTEWFFIDSGPTGLIRSMYDRSNYFRLLINPIVVDTHKLLTYTRRGLIRAEMCVGILNNLLPIKRDTNISGWNEIFDSMLVAGKVCGCCKTERRSTCVTDPSLKCADVAIFDYVGYRKRKMLMSKVRSES